MICPPRIVLSEGLNQELYIWLVLLSPGIACILLVLPYSRKMLVDVVAPTDSIQDHQFYHQSAVVSQF